MLCLRSADRGTCGPHIRATCGLMCIHVGVNTTRQSTEYRRLLCNKSDMRQQHFLPYISVCFACVRFIICNYVRRAESRAEEG
ncbi:hypothetical protein BJ992_001216 [Sphaerisporangium rubeum]|uniref:Uncharacterized protein n=1 Tax=Sphaerisporangium rubeum TaxID=321317 RepID=A0A7X0M4Y9_9ACTN|nr:hypothetical protein [Sphaerisporangium rubeum]